MTSDATDDRTIGRRGGAYVGLAAALSALVGFVVLIIAARALSPAENADFQVFWAALFAAFGVLSGLSMETTRTVTAAGPSGGGGPRVLLVGVGVALAAGALLTVTMPLWHDMLSTTPGTDGTWTTATALAGGVAGYALHSTLVGSLAGTRRWGLYAVTISAESSVRLLLVLGALALGTGIGGFAVGSAAAALTCVVVLLLSPSARRAAWTRAEEPTLPLVRRILAAFLAQGANAVLVVGFPVLLRITTPDEVMATSAPLLLAMTLTRAPLLVPLNAYQGVAVTHFVRNRHLGLRAALPVIRIILAVGAVGAGLAALLGPWLLDVVADGYRLPGYVLAGLTADAALIAVLTLTGALCQATTLHRWYLAGWLTATGSAFLALLLPLSLDARTVVALALGPTLGIAVHLLGLRRARAPLAPPVEQRES
ncbi:polysaccharide biosynthesis protein [Cellulosimicrobium cellulans]|uniref:hypothetical protein n=1 Tax=Cellulosimicrobium cellulans TaxID=1710 RepID=UPI0018833284|nr:hypothetical protein [Cellulosimicrobium cellulans]MBE9937726.1 hypothetical protein [Cellulosimicrobium cellulans]